MRTGPRVSVLALVLLGLGGCAARPTGTDLTSRFSTKEIQGFQQFPVYTGTNLLGFVASGPERFNFRVWEGLVREDRKRQTLTLSVSGEDTYGFAAGFKGIASAALEKRDIASIQLVLVDPVELILENPFPAPDYAGRADFLLKPYIGSVLKVGRIEVEFVQEGGVVLSGSAALPHISPSVSYSLNEKENALIVAEDAFVGYKLFDPPPDAAGLAPFAFDYQFLRRTDFEQGWALLEPHSTVRAGDGIRFQVRASHPVHLFVFNLDSGGNVHLLFPNEQIAYENPLQGNRSYTFPEDPKKAFQVDQVAGVEEFVFMVFRQPRPEMAELVASVRQGRVKGDQFRAEPVVVSTRGVGTIVEVQAKDRVPVPGFDQAARRIRGLPADYKDIFVLQHR